MKLFTRNKPDKPCYRIWHEHGVYYPQARVWLFGWGYFYKTEFDPDHGHYKVKLTFKTIGEAEKFIKNIRTPPKPGQVVAEYD